VVTRCWGDLTIFRILFSWVAKPLLKFHCKNLENILMAC
jgi:hypothetical protein